MTQHFGDNTSLPPPYLANMICGFSPKLELPGRSSEDVSFGGVFVHSRLPTMLVTTSTEFSHISQEVTTWQEVHLYICPRWRNNPFGSYVGRVHFVRVVCVRGGGGAVGLHTWLLCIRYFINCIDSASLTRCWVDWFCLCVCVWSGVWCSNAATPQWLRGRDDESSDNPGWPVMSTWPVPGCHHLGEGVGWVGGGGGGVRVLSWWVRGRDVNKPVVKRWLIKHWLINKYYMTFKMPVMAAWVEIWPVRCWRNRRFHL